jgi:iron-sulfur cluster repair protein YtfE (RIC family)
MQDVIDRLKQEHEQLAVEVHALLPRVGRRPVSLLALQDTLRMLDTQLANHEREEERKLFPAFGAATDPLEALLEGHGRIERGRKALRDALANWVQPPPGTPGPEDVACQAEDLLHAVLEQFAEEERQVFNLARAKPAPAGAAEAPAPKAAKGTKGAKGDASSTAADAAESPRSAQAEA